MDNLKWYMISTISGKEEKVVESLKNRVFSEGLEGNFDLETGFRIMLVPHIAPKELDKKNLGEDYKIKQRNLFRGYIFVKMNMTNSAWFVVRNTQYVTGLVGSSGQRAKPTPVSNLEIRKMEKRVQKITKEFSKGIIVSPYLPGVIVQVIAGPTKGQIGAVLQKNDEREVALIELILFERKTPTEIAYKNLIIKK